MYGDQVYGLQMSSITHTRGLFTLPILPYAPMTYPGQFSKGGNQFSAEI